MKQNPLLPVVSALFVAALVAPAASPSEQAALRNVTKGQAINHSLPIPNPAIDYEGFKALVVQGQEPRERARLTEEDFLQAMRTGAYVLLDARSEKNYRLRHITGAVNLPFTEFTEENLAKIIPSKETKILIYCNNNFVGAPQSFAAKRLTASLNVNTQASLRAYGYHRIHELGPLLDVNNTVLPFSGTEVAGR